MDKQQWTKRCSDIQADNWKDGMEKLVDRKTDRWTERQTTGKTSGHTNGEKDVQTVTQTDRKTDKPFNFSMTTKILSGVSNILSKFTTPGWCKFCKMDTSFFRAASCFVGKRSLSITLNKNKTGLRPLSWTGLGIMRSWVLCAALHTSLLVFFILATLRTLLVLLYRFETTFMDRFRVIRSWVLGCYALHSTPHS